MAPERLQKVLARAGVASRRKSEEFILEGRVTVNGVVVSALGTKVEPTDDVRVDGERLSKAQLIYLILNKPRGILCSTRSEPDHPSYTELVPHVTQRLFCVGRLDADSSGLILLTNDGDLTQLLTHPSSRIPKTYEVKVRGTANQAAVEQLRKGVYLAEGRVKCDRVNLKHAGRASSTLEIEIHQGINREIRRVLAKVGLPVSELRRTSIGPLRLGPLKLAHHRKLTEPEVRALYQASAPERPEPKAKSKSKPRRTLRPKRRSS